MDFRQCPDQLFVEECRIYTLDTWMLIPIGLVFAIQFAVILWGLIDTIRSDDRGWFPALITLGLGGIVILVATAWAIGAMDGIRTGLIAQMITVWGSAIACLSFALFGWLITLVFSLFARSHYGMAMIRQLLATVSLFLLSPMAWFLWVEFDTPMPQLSFTAPDWFHEGKVKVIQAELEPGWNIQSKRLDSLKPGTYPIPIVFHKPPWTIQTETDITVSAAEASLDFPLRVGNQWVFSKRTEHGAKGGHTFFSRRGKAYSTTEKEAIRMSILDMHQNEGKLWFSAEISYSDKPAQTFMLMPKDGQTLYRATPQDPWVIAANTRTPSSAALSVDTVDCTFKPMGLKNCQCSARPGGPLSVPPGPLDCSISNNKNVVGSAIRGVVGLFSLGLIDTGNRYKIETLGHSNWTQGPDSESGVPPEWVTTEEPMLACMGGRYLPDMRSSKVLSQLRSCASKHKPVSYEAAGTILALLQYGDYQIQALKRLEPVLDEAVNREHLMRYVGQEKTFEARFILFDEEIPKPETP